MAKFIIDNNEINQQGSIDTNISLDGDILKELRNINQNILALNGNMRNKSQTNASTDAWNAQTSFRDRYDSNWGSTFNKNSDAKVHSGKSKSTGGFADNLLDEMFGSNDFAKTFNSGLNKYGQDFLKDLSDNLNASGSKFSGEFGKNLGRKAGDWFKGTDVGKKLIGPIDNFKGELAKSASSVVNGFGENGFAGAAKAASGSIESLSTAAGAAAVPFIELTAALIAIEIVTGELEYNFKQCSEAASAWGEAAMQSIRREDVSGKKAREAAQKRLEQDVETLIKTPFQILEDAAQKAYEAWDANVRIINQTQGYTKSDLQTLMGNYATRLRSEGLSSVVNAADLTNNLGSVLKSGLSGKVAEEFAYQATLLNNLIPSQDFFNYASTYASVAANLMKNGAAQDVAIQQANESLNSFANSLLYASRELSGGFSTGLQNASDLYTKAVNISIAARTNNSNQIAGTLASVAAVTGAIAPDLANSLTDAIYNAAVGGNADQLVALRSLSGLNASNTEFLKVFATNPQEVFSRIFTNLANMYNQTPGAFMEAAEGYSSIFGLSTDAFARVDFNYLAKAISSMNTDSEALSENFKLLESGQSTLTKEQLRNQQVNEYMIEEGLSYVLDSEAGRMIQQHMWDEQIAREMQETTYGVDLQGKSIELIETIDQSIKNIINLLNPVAWVKNITAPLRALSEESGLEKDIAGVLEATKVGVGNAQAYRNLLTRGSDLQLVPKLIELLGGTSAYGAARQNNQAWNDFANFMSPASLIADQLQKIDHAMLYTPPGYFPNSYGPRSSSISSQYSWGTVGKSAAIAASALLGSNLAGTLGGAVVDNSSSSKAVIESLAKNVGKMLADEYIIDKFVKEGKSYEEFAASASAFGITDFGKALEEVGYNETDIQGYFSQQETKQGAEELANIRADERDFRDAGRQFWREDFWDKHNDPLFEQIEIVKNDYLQKIIDNQVDWKAYFKDQFVDAWMHTRWDKQFWQQFNDYFFEHKIYNGGTLKLNTLEEVQKKEKAQKGDLSNALAEYLTLNNQNLEDLKDPTIQTNMLLSQILVVCNGILNQTARTEGAISLSDSISALANGLIKQK